MKVGDRVTFKDDSGLLGTIKCIDSITNHGLRDLYYVQWDCGYETWNAERRLRPLSTYYGGGFGGRPPEFKAVLCPLRPNDIACQHTWRHYEGLMETYDYCEKCDEKK